VGGFHAVLEAYYVYNTNILSIFKFVKILNHSPAQVLSNKKKTQLYASSVGRDIPSTIFYVLTHTGYVLCAHCKYVKF
jgi:hypothetical protein